MNPDWQIDCDEDDSDLDMLDNDEADNFEAEMSQANLERFRLDTKDFPELKWHYNLNAETGANTASVFNDAMSSKSFQSGSGALTGSGSGLSGASNKNAFYDVQKILKQEKGEDLYTDLKRRKWH